MKLAPFIAGAFGSAGFGLSLLAGIAADNSLERILLNAFLSSLACYAVGYVVGTMAQQVAIEHAAHVSKMVAEQDARKAQADLEEAAAIEQAVSEAAVATSGGAMVGTTAGAMGGVGVGQGVSGGPSSPATSGARRPSGPR